MAHSKPDNALYGLSDKQVQESRETYGWNLLTPPKRPSMWKLYLEKFNDPVIRILLVAALLSFVISMIEGEYAETIGIFFAIFLATGIGFYFEYDANKKFDLLNAVGEETPVKVDSLTCSEIASSRVPSAGISSPVFKITMSPTTISFRGIS